MKALIPSLALLLISSSALAQGQYFFPQVSPKPPARIPNVPAVQYSISDFSLRADNTFVFNLNGQGQAYGVQGTFAAADTGILAVDAGEPVVLTVKKYDRHVTVILAKAGVKTVDVFIVEATNGQFITLTAAPIKSSTQNAAEDLKRLIDVATLANGGDVGVGLQKAAEEFRKNPRLTLQAYLTRLSQRRANAPIPVAGRNQLQATRSFEELEGGSAADSKPVPVKRKPAVRKPRPAPPQATQDLPPYYRTTAPPPSRGPLNLLPWMR